MNGHQLDTSTKQHVQVRHTPILNTRSRNLVRCGKTPRPGPGHQCSGCAVVIRGGLVSSPRTLLRNAGSPLTYASARHALGTSQTHTPYTTACEDAGGSTELSSTRHQRAIDSSSWRDDSSTELSLSRNRLINELGRASRPPHNPQRTQPSCPNAHRSE